MSKVTIPSRPGTKSGLPTMVVRATKSRIDFFGGLPKDNPFVKLDSNKIHYKELTIHGTSGSLPRHNKEALDLFVSGKVKASEYITHVFPLDRIAEGIAAVESGRGLKVVIKI